MPEFISILRWIRDIVYPQLLETNENVKIVADNMQEVKALNISIKDGVLPFEKITTTTETIESLLELYASNGDTVIVKEDGLVYTYEASQWICKSWKTVYSIAELEGLDVSVYSKAKLLLDGRSGDFIYDDNQSAVNNGGTVFDGWVRQYSGAVDVKWFGAKGDNIQDDTDYINKTLSLGGGISFPKGTYKITNSLSYTGTKSIFIDGGGATLNCVSPEMGTVLYIRPSEAIDFCLVKNLKISGNSIAKIGIHVDSRDNRITDIRIDDNAIEDLDNVLTASSTTGIRVDANNNSTLDITSNFIYNIKRTQVNPSISASIGIGVYGLECVANISNNAINGVSSPVGDADADGIQVFSKNRLDQNVRQSAMPSISNNRIQQVKGRFIKLQSSNGKVYSNYMSNVGIELIDGFKGVDAQTGGVDIFDNTIRIGTFTGGSSLVIFSLQMKSTGDFENAYIVKNNQITLEQNITFGCFLASTTNSNATVLIDGNIIQDKTNTFACATFVSAMVSENMSNYMIKISNNIIPLGVDGKLFRFYSATLGLLTDATTGPLISNILKLHITDNIASSFGTNTKVISFEPSGGNYPYLQYLTILGNSNFTKNEVYCQGMDVKKLPESTSFYYGTDGSTGGLVNAPAGFTRYVSVETPSKDCVRLWNSNNSSYVVYNKTAATAFKYTGITI